MQYIRRMRPLFTLHAGEYLVGSYLEQRYPELQIWVPTKDTGIDLLVTDGSRRRTCALQVKFSKDFLATHMRPVFRKSLRACGWWTFNREKLQRSRADLWILVLQGFSAQSTDFVVISPRDLLERLDATHGKSPSIQSYVWVSSSDACWETRGLAPKDQLLVASGNYKDATRRLTSYLNNWRPLERRLNVSRNNRSLRRRLTTS
jgi:hypothetical protein